MGSLFDAPKVNNRATKTALNKATNTATSSSKSISSAASDASKAITGAVNTYAPAITSTANSAAAGLTDLGSRISSLLQPLNLNAGGFTTSLNNGTVSVAADPARQALINALSGNYLEAADAYGALRNLWTPGESALREAQLASIENARTANISDLRQNLAKRAVLGSSFASDAQTRTNLDYENQKNNVIAQTYLQELDAQHQLIGDQYTAAANAVSTKINELNLEGNLGLQLSSQATDLMKQAAQLQASLAADAAQLQLQGSVAAGQLGVQGITNAGNILTTGKTSAGQIATTGLTNVANTNATLAAKQAELDAQAQAGAGQLLGTIGSIALAPLTGGTSLLGLPANMSAGPASTLFGGVSPYFSTPGTQGYYLTPQEVANTVAY